ncbi:peptidase M22, glycoprotease [Alkaliphilus metalliredigens QYMF]|uniref:Peptidase M22, glycoprotease n=1 Tax=Alkaliphilus metalliredigens (strain QYMF) TaxID=293826 RepID=A6TLG1_ALKMQ|nr:tRNA (adenosine(37)-N6)-threonylcarbamoyltransferase complex dimerization subunit type 1 TsaB [Alkaliphilus metalliredigens]ABR47029.1 peptidase M22, glycoprotease [Alkaliphilus metalliredigens QYMF]
MKILALDTSSIVGTVALLDGEKLAGEIIVNYKRTHSQQLMPMIQDLLESCALKPKDIDVFAVSLGPGSFTGLRIGVSTMKAMAQALDKPIVGISTLDGLAFNLLYSQGIICPIIDAQRDMVYTASYRWSGEDFQQVKDYEMIHIDEMIQRFDGETESIIFVGDAVEKLKERIQHSLKKRAVFPPGMVAMARASAIGELARRAVIEGRVQKPEDVMPIYMRKSEAEKQFEAKMKGRE